MARSQTNRFALAVAIEASTGVLPATPLWINLEPNTIGTYGGENTTTPRTPITPDRQNRKGTVTDRDSSVEWEGDTTKHHFLTFIEGFVFAQRASSTVMERIQAGSDYDNLAAATATTMSHDALTSALIDNVLVFSRGFTNSGNNGLLEVTTGSTTTTTAFTGTAFTAETPATTTGARIDVCGRRFTDLTWDDTAKTVGSAAQDLSTLGLTVGQHLRVGSDINAFTNGQVSGRITAITAALITLDKIENLGTGTLDGGGNESASSVDLLYGPYVRNVAITDSDFLDQTYQFEAVYDDLQDPTGTGDEYEYSIGNQGNEMTVDMPGQDKSTISFSFIGTDSEDITTTRKSNTANAVEPVQTTAFNTSSDFARLNLWDSTESDLTSCFKTLTLTIGNEVSTEKCLGTLGAVFMNTGNFTVGIEAELLFTTSSVSQSIKDNDTVAFDVLLFNDDGALHLDIPSLTLGGGGKSFPVNESITISTTGTAFKDPVYDTSLAFTEFPYFPEVS